MSKSYNEHKQYQSYSYSKTDYVPQYDSNIFMSPTQFLDLIRSFPDTLNKDFQKQSQKDKTLIVIFLIVAVLIVIYMFVWLASVQKSLIQ